MRGAGLVEKIEDLREEAHSARACCPSGGEAGHGRLSGDGFARLEAGKEEEQELDEKEEEQELEEGEEQELYEEEGEEEPDADNKNSVHAVHDYRKFGSHLGDAPTVGLEGGVAALETEAGFEAETGTEAGLEEEATEAVCGEDIDDHGCHRSCSRWSKSLC